MKILITGVSSGLGQAFCRLEGNDLEIYGVSRNPASSEILSYEDFDKMPSPDVLILNAAMGDFGIDFENLDESTLTEIMISNLVKPLSFAAKLYKNSLLNDLKSMIIVGSRFSSQSYISAQSKDDLPGYGYCISKVALSLFTQIVRKENLQFTVNIIHPGVLKTQLGNTEGLDVAAVAALLLAKIKSAVFSKQFEGIYDLNNDKVIPF